MSIGSKTFLLILLAALSGACGGGPKAVRGSDVAGLDDEAMGTGLDRRDLQLMLHENMESLQNSALVKRWEGENRPAVAVLQMRNDTSEHIDSVLNALITEVETSLVNAGHVRVISRDSQPEMIAEVEKQQSDAFDASTVSRLGNQVGVRYFVTGRVYNADERQSGERRVQYFLFMRVLDVETGDILWQNSAAVTKAIVK
jgi:penicillin-binding protein activator